MIIAKAGEPIAELRPLMKMDVVFGGMAGLIEYDDDAFSPEADAEVAAMFDDDIWA